MISTGNCSDGRWHRLRQNTLAVVILYGGKIVAEHCAKGISPTAQLPGWSMAKCFTITIIGLLVARKQLDIHQSGVLMEWGNQKDRILSPQQKNHQVHLILLFIYATIQIKIKSFEVEVSRYELSKGN